MAKEECIEMEGVVEDIVRSDVKVRLSNGHMITAYPAGKLSRYKIRILPGDKVKVEMSPYDITKGRIIWRDKN